MPLPVEHHLHGRLRPHRMGLLQLLVIVRRVSTQFGFDSGSVAGWERLAGRLVGPRHMWMNTISLGPQLRAKRRLR
jgi:hypothetical protein